MVPGLQQQIAFAVQAGADLDEIEQAIIDPAPIDEEQKAAMWLYAEALDERRGDSQLIEREVELLET
jgi:hypothetical protein